MRDMYDALLDQKNEDHKELMKRLEQKDLDMKTMFEEV